MIGLVEKFAAPWFFEIGRMAAFTRAQYYKAWLDSFAKDSLIAEKIKAKRSEYQLVGFIPGIASRNMDNKLCYLSFKKPTCFYMHRLLAGGAYVSPGGVEFTEHVLTRGEKQQLRDSRPIAALTWVWDMEILSERGWREYFKDSVAEFRRSKLSPERLAGESKERLDAYFKPLGGFVNVIYTRAEGDEIDLSLGEGVARRPVLFFHAHAGPGYAFTCKPLESLILMRPGLRFNKSVLSEVENPELETGLVGVSG